MKRNVGTFVDKYISHHVYVSTSKSTPPHICGCYSTFALKSEGKVFSLSRKLDQLTVIDSSVDNKWYDDSGNARCLEGSSSAGSLRMSPFTFQELDHACRLVKVPPALSRLREERRVILG